MAIDNITYNSTTEDSSELSFFTKMAKPTASAIAGIALYSSVALERPGSVKPNKEYITPKYIYQYDPGLLENTTANVKISSELAVISSSKSTTAEKFSPELLGIASEDDLARTLLVANKTYPMAKDINLSTKEDYEEDDVYICVNITLPESIDSVLDCELDFIRSLSEVSQNTFNKIVTSYIWI